MLNVNALDCKFDGAGSRAMCIFFSLKEYPSLFCLLAFHQRFLSAIFAAKGCHILRQKSTTYLDMSGERMVGTLWYHLQALGIDEGERKGGGERKSKNQTEK